MKKNLTIILAVMLFVSAALMGCSNKGNNANANNEGNAQTSNTEKAKEKEVIEADPTVVAVAKEMFQEKALSQSELVTAMGKISIKQSDAKNAAAFLEVDFSVQALRAAVGLYEGKFPEKRIEGILQNSGYTAQEIAYAMENYASDDAASIIEEAMTMFEITSEETDLLAAFHGN